MAAFVVTQFLAFGQFTPVYEEFGTKSYNYEGSYWNTPLEMDWFNKYPEPTSTYLLHMTFGHHGVFSLTPIFLFSVFGALRSMARRDRLAPRTEGDPDGGGHRLDRQHARLVGDSLGPHDRQVQLGAVVGGQRQLVIDRQPQRA